MKNIIIIGAGVAGCDVLNEINKDKSLDFKVVGFVDDDKDKIGNYILGVKVLGTQNQLIDIINKWKIDEVIIAIPSAEGERISEYLKVCNLARVDVRIVPRVREIIEGKAHIRTIRKVQVEDLLGRPVVKSDVEELKEFFKDKKVFVTGAAGSIGSELSRQIAAYNPKSLILFDWWENGVFELDSELRHNFPKNTINCVIGNIHDEKKLSDLFQKYKPDFVYHAAAYKHVPLMEEFPEEAVRNNVFGTYNVVKTAFKYKVKKFVLISTDKAANPKSVMGATKLLTEAIARHFNKKRKTKFVTVRFGNVLDSYGSVVPTFRKQIDMGGPLTITDPRMVRYFMTIPEAAQLILKAGAMGEGGELFVLDMGEPVKIVDLAENIIRLSGLIPGKDIEIKYTGIRKGEKLREILFNKKEKALMSKTRDKKIFITQSNGVDENLVIKELENLKIHVVNVNRKGIFKILSKLIKTFKLKNID